MTATTTITPQTREQRRRIAALVKQAADALTLLSQEGLNLDMETRNVLNEARQLVSSFENVVNLQPVDDLFVCGPGLTQEETNRFPKGRWT